MKWNRFLFFASLITPLNPIVFPPLHAEPVQVVSTQVPLNAARPEQDTVGGLRYLGGIALTSENIRFGGLSGLMVDRDGVQLRAISDQGDWFSGMLTYNDAGRLSGLIDVEMGPLLGLSGRPLKSKRKSDSEALTRFEGGFAVSFERKHRVWRYEKLDGVPVALPPPPGLEGAPNNGGVEALTSLPGGRLLAIAEDLRTEQGDFRGWLYADGIWRDLTFAATEDFKPTDLATMPDGEVLVLERSYSLLAGPAARISRIAAIEIKENSRLVGQEVARLELPLTVDNMEGLAFVNTEVGSRLYLVSDDNFSPTQQTLILMFEFLRQ